MRRQETSRGPKPLRLTNKRVRMGLSQDGQAFMLGLTRDVYQNMELARGPSK